jgi:signal transduction histidine kinase
MKSNVRWPQANRLHRVSRAHLVLAVLMAASVVIALALSWTATLGRQFDNYAYDFLFRAIQPAPWTPASIILAIDEATLSRYGGNVGDGIRRAIADGLEKIEAAPPAAVAVDVILAEPGVPEADARLEEAFAQTRNLVLESYLLENGTWSNPIERFRKHAAALGHVHADFDRFDSVSRDVPLMIAGGRDRRWALALEAFRAAHHAEITESPDDLIVGITRVPSRLRDEAIDGRTMRIRYPPLAMGGIPRVSIAALDDEPRLAAQFAGKAVFVGETAAAVDSWATPYSNGKTTPGVEMHAAEYETLAQQRFLVDAPLSGVVLVCLMLATAAGVAFALGSGWKANLAAAGVVVVSQGVPAVAFANSVVWPWVPGTLTAVISVGIAATWRHLLVRRELAKSERERTRYQRAMQFVTHEMRTPLTAIQGSSELIGRYASMPEAKRKEMAELINAESKRLARMIETFLSVEKLSAGEMAIKREEFPLDELVEACVKRARPVAERKEIEITVEGLPQGDLTGDRELMEYAVYNLLTNAVKYSQPQTRVRVFGEDERGGHVRLSVEDQGMGMDKKEVKRIFEKFYRTKRAEQSGEAGTGIGLSIVEQIVTQHGGEIQVDSEPGRGSRFTLVLRRTL